MAHQASAIRQPAPCDHSSAVPCLTDCFSRASLPIAKASHDTSHDLLLCALYYRTFVADRGSEEAPAGPSPFKPPEAGPNPNLPHELGKIQIRR